MEHKSRKSFEDLRQNDCIYINKTKYLYEMIMAPKGQFFVPAHDFEKLKSFREDM